MANLTRRASLSFALPLLSLLSGACVPSESGQPPPTTVVEQLTACAPAGEVDWSFTSDVYSYIPGDNVPRPGMGAGLKSSELQVGGDEDQYESYFYPALSALPASYTQIELCFDVRTDASPRHFAPVLAYAVKDSWQTEELASGVVGLWWQKKPGRYVLIQDLGTPAASGELCIDVTSAHAKGNLNHGLALISTDNKKAFTYFGSCGHSDAAKRPFWRITRQK